MQYCTIHRWCISVNSLSIIIKVSILWTLTGKWRQEKVWICKKRNMKNYLGSWFFISFQIQKFSRLSLSWSLLTLKKRRKVKGLKKDPVLNELKMVPPEVLMLKWNLACKVKIILVFKVKKIILFHPRNTFLPFSFVGLGMMLHSVSRQQINRLNVGGILM